MTGIDPDTLDRGVNTLIRSDSALAVLHARNGRPPLWARPLSFASLVLFILEQQVSLASARAALVRLHRAMGQIEAGSFLAISPEDLRAIGFSRQKASYCRGIAEGIGDGEIDLAAIASLGDADARQALITIRGVGPWTADVVLLFCLGRADAWPTGDRALQLAMSRTLDLPEVPDPRQTDAIAERWRPYRGVAAFLLWHDYLGGRAYQDDSVIADILG